MCLGETVDGRVCETLEEIFRRVRFRSIDLEATSLDEEVSLVSFSHFDSALIIGIFLHIMPHAGLRGCKNGPALFSHQMS